MKKILNNYDKDIVYILKQNERNIIIKDIPELDFFIDESLYNNLNKSLHLGIIQKEDVLKIKKDIQNLPKNKEKYIDYLNYDLVINQSEIRHIKDNKVKITSDDIHNYIKKIFEILLKYDYVSYDIQKDEGLRFKKEFSEGTFVAFIIVSKKKKNIYSKDYLYDKKRLRKKEAYLHRIIVQRTLKQYTQSEWSICFLEYNNIIFLFLCQYNIT